PGGRGVGWPEEDAAGGDVAGDAVDLAEQQRFQPHHEHLVEAQMRALFIDHDGGGGRYGLLGGRFGRRVVIVSSGIKGRRHGNYPTLSSNEVKKLTCRITR